MRTEDMSKVSIDIDALDAITVEGLKDIYRLAHYFEETKECLAVLVVLEYMLSTKDYKQFLDKLDEKEV